jgi:hypothetical protein
VNRTRDGRFQGYRVNCECVPSLPSYIVAAAVADPRRIPYLLIWTRRAVPIDSNSTYEHLFGEPREAVRLKPSGSPEWADIERWDGTQISLRLVQRPLPRRGGNTTLLICNRCDRACRTVYGREAVKHAWYVRRGDWLCRQCSHLSYASEGEALIYRTRSHVTRALAGLRLYDRPEHWEPFVFTSPQEAFDCGLVENVWSNS